MKRLFLLLLLCLTLCFSSCARIDNEVERMDTSSIVENNSSYLQPPPMPYTLRFNSFEEVAELKNIVNQNEIDVKKYLNDKNFAMNGVCSTEDVKKLFETIGNVNMLHLTEASAYKLVNVIYYVDYGYIMTTYTKDSATIRLLCYLNIVNNEEPSSELLVDTLSVSNKTMNVYKVTDEESPYTLKGHLLTNNSLVRMLIIESEEEHNLLENIKDHIILAALSSLISE